MFDKWDMRFIDLATTIGNWSSCYKDNRNVGAIIVKDKRILTTGYNGAPSKIKSCKEKKECLRIKNNIESGTKHELCYAVHAEQNAIIQAAKFGIDINNSCMYVTHKPCAICTKMIINAGIKKIIYKNDYYDEFATQLINEAGIEIIQYK